MILSVHPVGGLPLQMSVCELLSGISALVRIASRNEGVGNDGDGTKGSRNEGVGNEGVAGTKGSRLAYCLRIKARRNPVTSCFRASLTHFNYRRNSGVCWIKRIGSVTSLSMKAMLISRKPWSWH